MNENDGKRTASDQRQAPEMDARIALYERLLAEKDGILAEKNNRISDLTTALSHERLKTRRGIWPDFRAGLIGYGLGVPLGFVKSLVTQAFITHTASAMVLSFLAIYFSSVSLFAFFMVRRVYRSWKAARRVSSEASYAVQLFYCVVLSFAMTMEIVTNPYGPSASIAGIKWFLIGSLSAAGYNFLRLRADTKRSRKPLPGLSQISDWLALKA